MGFPEVRCKLSQGCLLLLAKRGRLIPGVGLVTLGEDEPTCLGTGSSRGDSPAGAVRDSLCVLDKWTALSIALHQKLSASGAHICTARRRREVLQAHAVHHRQHA